MTPQTVRFLRKSDRRYANCYGLYALNDADQIVSQVLLLHIETRTKKGRELVGGIQGVGTFPAYSRQGYSTALMKRAHELFAEAGIHISFLLTSASLVAHEMYEKLGYSTMTAFSRGIKRTTRPRGNPSLRFRKYEPKYATVLDNLFARQTKGALGFVYRQSRYLNVAARVYPDLTEKINVAFAEDRVLGYVCARSEGGAVVVEELVAVEDAARKLILRELERKLKPKYLLFSNLIDSQLAHFYAQEGFSIQAPSWARVMATSIDGSLNGREIADLYDVNNGRFVLYSIDNF